MTCDLALQPVCLSILLEPGLYFLRNDFLRSYRRMQPVILHVVV